MGRYLKIGLSILIAIFLFSLFPDNSRAATDHLLINEVYYDVASSKGVEGANEWVEIYNPTGSEIDLKDWTISDATVNKRKINLEAIIKPNGYAVITKDFSTWSFWDLSGETLKIELGFTIGSGLNNDGDKVILRDAADLIVDQISYGSDKDILELKDVPEGHSLERLPKGGDNFIDQKQPSPGIGLEKIVYSNNILVNELLPHPSVGTDNEFIELYNSSSEDVDIGGWILEDLGGKQYIIPKNTESVMSANSYKIFYKSVTKISLNDAGDSINLLWPDGNLCSSSQEYKNADYDISWSRNMDNSWFFSTTATPEKANIFTSKQDEVINAPVIPVEEAKKEKKNEWVKVEGVVTSPPGLFGKRVMYIQDGSGGIKIYFNKALWPKLHIGDRVIIYGKISISLGEFQIKVYDSGNIIIIGHDPPPEPKKLVILKLSGFVGRLIRVSGRVVKISGSTIWINDGTGELRLYFYPATGIKKLGLKKGDWIIAVGVLSKTKAGLRLLPRSKSDLKIYKKAVESKKEPSIVNQVLGVETAQAAGADYRNFKVRAPVEPKGSLNLLGIYLVLLGFLSLVFLSLFVRIRERYDNYN